MSFPHSFQLCNVQRSSGMNAALAKLHEGVGLIQCLQRLWQPWRKSGFHHPVRATGQIVSVPIRIYIY